MINWEAVRAKGEQGLLTAYETDALVELATYSRRTQVHIDVMRCRWCRVKISHRQGAPPQHRHDCPVTALAKIKPETKGD